jgi:hypothetical protein
VGGAYLPEMPQRRKTPKFLDVIDALDAIDTNTRYSNNTRCNHDVNKLSGSNAHDTNDIHYRPNTSRRRQPCASSTTTSWNRIEGIEPVGELGND